jgi:hypothetical protein
MIRVKISTGLPAWPLQRQTPGGTGRWDDCEFLINQDVADCDYWVVIDDLSKVERTRCPTANTIFINCEPPSVRSYRKEFLAQFSTVVSCNSGTLEHPNIIHSQPGLRWGVGVRSVDGELRSTMNFDEIRDLPQVKKTKLMSVITSSRDVTRGHRRRIRFVRRLKEYFGYQLDVFGFGIRDIDDKLDAIAGYQYHIVIENSSYPDYWTEKLADAYLARAYPLYAGCPNLEQYFAAESFTRINLGSFGETVSIIQKVISARQYESSESALAAARNLVLNKHNLFQVISERCPAPQTYPCVEKLALLPARLLEPRRALLVQKIRNTVLHSWKGQNVVRGIQKFLPVIHS